MFLSARSKISPLRYVEHFDADGDAVMESARKAGLVRRGIDLGIAADAFTAMLFAGMLHSSLTDFGIVGAIAPLGP